MSHDLHETSICRSPHAFINKKGEAILVELLDENHHQRLIDMYLRFEPRNSFGGLPPADDNSCVAWVNGMIADATNLVALSFDEGIVGHLALFPINSRRCELLVVVSPAYQNTGIGTRLVRCSTQLAYEIDFEQIWLSVEMANKRARHVYKKCGFRCLDRPDVGEVDMGLDLRQYEDAVSVHVEQIMDRNAVSICEGTPCRTALEVLLREEVASLPVVDRGGRLTGILSEADLILPANLEKRVEEVATREVLTACEQCTVAKVIRMIEGERLRCIPVVDSQQRLVGTVNRKNVLSYYKAHFDGGELKPPLYDWS